MEEQGPFDNILKPDEPPPQQDRTAIAIVALGIVLGIFLLFLVLPPVSILDDDGGGGPSASADAAASARDEMPPPPLGFESVSALYDITTSGDVGQPRALTVTLSTNVNPTEELSLFTFEDDAWQLIGPATAVAGGSEATGEVSELPSNVAVFRASGTTTARVVAGSLPPGAELDPRAQGSLSVLNLTGLAPAPDGQISGGPVLAPDGLTIPIVPTISATTAVDVETVNAILLSPDVRAAHVQAVVDLVATNAFAGIDLDYRFDAALQAEFTTMAQEIATGLAPDGKTLTITMPAPVQEGAGWSTQGFDIDALAPSVDAFKLAPEPDQTAYYQQTEAALGFLTSRVGANKLLLSVSAFSRERGVDGVRTLTLTEALGLAGTPALAGEGIVAPDTAVQVQGQNLTGGAQGLRWDEGARAVTFAYTGPGGERTVWLANLFSEAFRLDLASRYALRGVAVEDASLGTEDANVWPVVAQYAQSGNVTLVKPNGDLLQPSWSASGGTLESERGVQVSWRAPAEPGTYTLTLVVSDGIIRIGRELSVPVEIAGASAP